MPETVLDASERFRRALLVRQARASGRLVRAYGRIYRDIEQQIDDTLDGLWDAEEGSYKRFKQERLLALKRQVAAEINKYGAFAYQEMLSGSQDAINAAIKDSRTLTQLSLPLPLQEAGIMSSWTQLPSESIETMLGFLANDSPLHTALVDRLGPEVADRVGDAMVKGIALGWNPRRTARSIAKQWGQGLNWSMTTVRTAQLWSYRESTRASYAANSKIVKGWIWQAALDGRTCMSCVAMHGTKHPHSEPLNDHHSGRCLAPGMLVDARSVIAFVSRRYRGDMLRIGLASGQFVTVTPNHPILTDRGWVAAGLLREGDNIVSSRFQERAALGMSPHKDQMPTLIENMPAALGMDHLTSVPCSAEDFHGDGVGSDVYVVRTNGLLADRRHAAILEPFGKEQVGGGRGALGALAAFGNSATVFGRMLHATTSFLRDLDTTMMLFNRGLFGQELVGLGLGAHGDVGNFQMPTNYATRDAEGMGQGVLGFAREIAAGNLGSGQLDAIGATGSLDAIVEIDCTLYDGHVYNLQTKDNWYNAGGIVTYNGRCVNMPIVHNCAMLPETVTYRDLGLDVDDDLDVPQPGDGEKWFKSLTEEQQRDMMGKGVYEAWREGKFAFSKLSTAYDDPVYGQMLRQATLKDLTGGGGETDALQPTISRAEADVWSANSALQGPFYHGTSAGDSIKAEGFRLDAEKKNGRILGDGVYITQDREKADWWGEHHDLLELRVNVKNPLSYSDISQGVGLPTEFRGVPIPDKFLELYKGKDEEGKDYEVFIWSRWDWIEGDCAKYFPELNSAERIAAVLQEMGVDAVMDEGSDAGIVIFNPRNIRVVVP